MDKNVAIIGLALQLPGIKTLPQLCEVMDKRIDKIGDLPYRREKNTRQYLKSTHSQRHEEYIKGAYLDVIDEFDYKFFGLSYKEARFMDPHQRLMLQNAYKAVEDAGYGGNCLRGTNTGVYIGFNANNQRYDSAFLNQQPENSNLAFTGNLNSIIAGRISYFLGLKGPAMVVDTACSSSITALHIAYQDIINENCDYAIVGAISLKMLLLNSEEKLGTESFDYRTRTFDNQSDGTGPGEAVISVVLKRNTEAIKDHNSIYAVIKGIAINHNGNTLGITAPSVAAQEEVILHAWNKAKINPEDLSFIEAHGTGTKLGDPVEIAALRRAFQKHTDKRQFCAIGSIKTNLGHVESVSGLLGLCKCIASLQNRRIYPSNHFELPNHRIDFHLSALYVNDSTRPIHQKNCLCALNSFGIGGTNGHMVITSSETNQNKYSNLSDDLPAKNIFVVSTKSTGALYRLLFSYDEFLSNSDCNIADLCYTSQTGRGHYTHRLAIITDTIEDLSNKIKNILCNGLDKTLDGDIMFRISVVKKQTAVFDISDIYNLQSYYCSGANISWHSIYGKATRRRIHLPTYEYDPIECWFTEQFDDAFDFYNTSYVPRDMKEPAKINNNDLLVILNGNEENTSRQQLFFKRRSNTYIPRDNDGTDIISWIIAKRNRVSHILFIYNDDIERNAEQLYNFLRLITEQKATFIKNITVVTNNSLKVLSGDVEGDHAFHLKAIMKAAIWEYPDITFKYWDFDDTKATDNLNKLFYVYPEFISVIRKNQRYVEVLDKTKIQIKRKILFQERGVYLITGGTGGVGLVLAEHLAHKGCVNIALIQRTHYNEMTDNIKASITQIARKGSHVSLWNADVRDETSMCELLHTLRKRYGRIAGIIHCATSTKGGRIAETSFHDYLQIMRTKAVGATFLHTQTACDEPDFIVLFSSAITVTGGYQSAAYIAANMFLTTFAQKMDTVENKIIAMQWSAWENTGLAKSVDANKELFEVLNPIDACYAFDAALQLGQSTVIIGKRNHQSTLFHFSDKLPFEFKDAVVTVPAIEKDYICTNEISKEKEVLIDNLDEMIHYVREIWFQIFECIEITQTDNFFEIGGDSISAMKIINKINKSLHCSLTVSSILGNPTIQQFSEYVFKTIKQEDCTQIQLSDTQALSPSQKRLFMHWITNPKSVIYNLPEAILITGNLDYNKLNYALQNIVRDNEIFRTIYKQNNNQLLSEIIDADFRDIEIVNLKNYEINQYIASFIKPFNLNTGPLLRVVLISLESEDKHIFLYDVHHIVFDGVTRDLFIRTLLKHYFEIYEKMDNEIEYRHYAGWIGDYLKTDVVAAQRQYWLDKLYGADTENADSLYLLFDENKGERLVLRIPENQCEKIVAYVAKEKGSLFMFMLTVYSIVLHYFTGLKSISIATPVSGRNHIMFDNVMGMFVNTLVLRNDVNEQESFQSMFQRIIKNTILDLSNQDYQYDDLVSDLKSNRNLKPNHLFQSMLVLQNKEFGKDITTESLTLEAYPIPITVVKFPYSMQLVRMEHCIECSFDYCTTMYSKNSMQALLTQFIKTIETVVEQPSIEILKLRWIDREKKRLEFNI